MDSRETGTFQQLFKEQKYLSIKNYLYNYLLRKRAVEKCLKNDRSGWILEVGSGISPLVTETDNIVYSDISLDAIRVLKQIRAGGYHVVANGEHLPFKAKTFSHVICSEVLEHLKNDRHMITEIFRTLQNPHGSLVVTVPHRKCYFSYDDRYVKHYRRYELIEIKKRLQSAGLQPILIQKVLGPLEKITMLLAVFLFSMLNKNKPVKKKHGKTHRLQLIDFMIFVAKWFNRFYAGYVWLDAKIMPFSFATVILIKSKVSHEKSQSNDPAT
jgi:ubiquinone/menaquinone biosynthesis C-methylase UbiE